MTRSNNPVQITLPADAVAALHALADAERGRWEGAAHIAVALIEDAAAEGVTIRKGDVYAAVAQEVDAAGATVAEWCSVYEAVGEENISEYATFSFNHWRCLRALAKRNRREIRAEAERWAATADEFGGRVVPVDRLRAALAGDDAVLPVPALERTLARVRRAVEAHARAVTQGGAGLHPGQRAAWEVVEAAARDYTEKFGGGDD